MSSPRPGCSEFRSAARLHRRDLLKVGMLGSAGLTLAQLLAAEALAAPMSLPQQRERSVIILWMRGGPSQLDMWDPKPDAPAEIRGEFSPIPTAVPGIHLSEHLPKSAALMRHWSIIRSMHFRKEESNTGHSDGDQVCFTGYRAGPFPDINIAPSVGSVVTKQLGSKETQLPTYVMVPRNIPGTGTGYLGPACAAFETQADPAAKGSFEVPNLQLKDAALAQRLSERHTLLRELDTLGRQKALPEALRVMDGFHEQALSMLSSPAARVAFDLDSEPRRVRESYGEFEQFTPRNMQGGDAPNWPQRMLLARRLVEAGVRLVTVDCRWWDTHQDNFWSLKNGFLPRWDQAYSALISDLHERGLLESTLVVAWGEMGRSPRISAEAGRDHWPQLFSAAIAGGGTRGGQIIGSSDKHASAPRDNPKIVQDVLATIYDFLGIDPSINFLDLAGRPHPILPCGTPIRELF